MILLYSDYHTYVIYRTNTHEGEALKTSVNAKEPVKVGTNSIESYRSVLLKNSILGPKYYF